MSDVESYKNAMKQDAGGYKPEDFVSPGSGTGGRKKLTKDKINSTSDRYGSVDDWLSPGSVQKRSWTPKSPANKGLSYFDMKD